MTTDELSRERNGGDEQMTRVKHQMIESRNSLFKGQKIRKPRPALLVGEDIEGEDIIRCPECGNIEAVMDCDVCGSEPGCVFCNQCHSEMELP